MSSKQLASVLFSFVLLGATACSETKSVAGSYLANNKASDASDSNLEPEDESQSQDGGSTDGEEDNSGNEEPGDDTKDKPTTDTPDTDKPTTDKPADDKPDDKPTEPEAPKASTYAEMNTKFFSKYCTACHGNKGGISLQTYANVKKNIAAVKKAALDDKTMPKGTSASAEDLKLLSDWIAAGTPE